MSDERKEDHMVTAPHDRPIEVWNGWADWYVSQYEDGQWPLKGPQGDRWWAGGVWYPVPSKWREIDAALTPSSE